MILDTIYDSENYGKGWFGYNVMPRAPTAVFVELLTVVSLVMALVLTPLTKKVVQKLWRQREITWHAPMFVGMILGEHGQSCTVCDISGWLELARNMVSFDHVCIINLSTFIPNNCVLRGPAKELLTQLTDDDDDDLVNESRNDRHEGCHDSISCCPESEVTNDRSFSAWVK